LERRQYTASEILEHFKNINHLLSEVATVLCSDEKTIPGITADEVFEIACQARGIAWQGNNTRDVLEALEERKGVKK
jgi:hypothetical protein